jgi:CheY-like chemotaxis protein
MNLRERIKILLKEELSKEELIKQVISFKRPNIEIIWNFNGQETVKLAINHQPNLILLDLNLPDINGIELIKLLQQNESTKNIPIIVMSADVNPIQIENAIDLGAKSYLTKPLELTVFIDTIDKWLMTNKK